MLRTSLTPACRQAGTMIRVKNYEKHFNINNNAPSAVEYLDLAASG